MGCGGSGTAHGTGLSVLERAGKDSIFISLALCVHFSIHHRQHCDLSLLPVLHTVHFLLLSLPSLLGSVGDGHLLQLLLLLLLLDLLDHSLVHCELDWRSRRPRPQVVHSCLQTLRVWRGSLQSLLCEHYHVPWTSTEKSLFTRCSTPIPASTIKWVGHCKNSMGLGFSHVNAELYIVHVKQLRDYSCY